MAAAAESQNAFVLLVQKQLGRIVDPSCAGCLVEHARMAIQGLGS